MRPIPATREGIRDRAMLHLAICAGLRVSELTGLRVEDMTLPSMSIRVHGKGRRERAMPLWKTTVTALRAWLAVRGAVLVPEVFVNARGEPMSRWGFAYLLKQHTEAAEPAIPAFLNKQDLAACVAAHLRDDHPASDAGHPQGLSMARTRHPATTEVYTRGDPTEKLEAMEAIVPPHLRRGSFQPPDKLIALLRGKS